VNQEKTNLDGKLALRIRDALLGSVEDSASSPSLPKNNYIALLRRKYKSISCQTQLIVRQSSDIRQVVVW
jgi:hypothetical protein